MEEKLKVKQCQQTCYGFPSQWDIFTDQDDYIYARYRWGCLTLTLNESELIFKLGVHGCLDGAMDTKELITLTKDVLDWSEYNDKTGI